VILGPDGQSGLERAPGIGIASLDLEVAPELRQRPSRLYRAPMTQRLVVVDHPVLADRLTVMRDRNTGHGEFRQALFEASAILAVEAARDLPVSAVEVQTPLESAAGSRLPSEITIVPVLRAGLGMVDGFLRLLPGARVGHVGVYRDEEEHRPVDYYERLPPGLADSHVFVVDPMLATGGSAVHALDRLRAAGAQRLALVCLVVAPEGLAAVEEHHPDVPIWTAAVDRELDENAYIRPGLGDAGDRVFGT
jgi:uracil phosphoribosyltransferase